MQGHWSRAGILCLMGLALLGCGKSNSEGANSASPSPSAQSAPASASDEKEANRKMLTQGVENDVFLIVAVSNQNGKRSYCSNDQSQQANAKFAVVNKTGTRPYISDLPLQLTEGDAIFKTANELAMDPAQANPGMPSTCYVLDMTDMPNSPTASQIQSTSAGEGLLLGQIKVVKIEFVNQFMTQKATGATDTRSYHVIYKIDSPRHARPFPEIEGKTFTSTCLLEHDNAENRWAFVSCSPTP